MLRLVLQDAVFILDYFVIRFILFPEVDFSKQKRQQELDVFWKQLDQVLNSESEGSRLFDVARLKYSVKRHLLPEDTDGAEAMVNTK